MGSPWDSLRDSWGASPKGSPEVFWELANGVALVGNPRLAIYGSPGSRTKG